MQSQSNFSFPLLSSLLYIHCFAMKNLQISLILLNWSILFCSGKKLEWLPATQFVKSSHPSAGWLPGSKHFAIWDQATYIGRADMGKGQVLGNYLAHYYPYELRAGDTKGKEVVVPQIAAEVLTYPPGTLSWAPVGRGFEAVPGFNSIADIRDIPNYLVLGGRSVANREHMFICRAFDSDGNLLVGTYRFSKPNKCYCSNGGVEAPYKHFEMLVVNAFGILNGIEG